MYINKFENISFVHDDNAVKLTDNLFRRLFLRPIIFILIENARIWIINDSLVKFRVVARDNRPERTKRRAITAISQGMNTEIDSANAMMVERKARYGT